MYLAMTDSSEDNVLKFQEKMLLKYNTKLPFATLFEADFRLFSYKNLFQNKESLLKIISNLVKFLKK